MPFSLQNLPLIQSRDNQKLKFVRAVRDEREREKVFVEGARLCEEVLKSDVKIESVFINEYFSENSRSEQLIKNFPQTDCEIYLVEDKAFNSIVDTQESQGIIAVCQKPETGEKILENALTADSLLILLHQINNPSNLGAILRTAEAAAVSGVITTKNSVNSFSPKSIRASMGASLRLPIWTNADFFEVLYWAKEKNIKSVCADVKSHKAYTEINWREPKLLIFGSEAHGLRDSEIESADETLFIPMKNNVESLNIAVACGVILFEAIRQNGKPT